MKKKMTEKKEIRLYVKFVILLLCFIIVIQIFFLTFSKYESDSNSNADVDIALYVLKEEHQNMTLDLGKIVPSDNVYVYEFSVSNEKDGNIAQVDIEYELMLRTTTNLPLEIRLYKKEEKSEIEAISTIEKDEDNMYFNVLKIEKQIFYYSTPRMDEYVLEIYFPEKYNEKEYQDITDVVEIDLDAKQIIDKA